MKHWPRQFSFWLALAAGAALVAEFAWVQAQRRNMGRLALVWRQQFRQSEELQAASPARTPENEQALGEEVARLRREIPLLRAELFPQSVDPAGRLGAEGRIGAYFDVAALMIRLRAAAAAANVIVKPDEHFGFGAYANEAPPAADMARVLRQCSVAETILGCLFLSRPRELLAVRREPIESMSATVDHRQRDYFALERGLSIQSEAGWETTAFQVEFSGETAALREFLTAVAHTPEVLIVRSLDVASAVGDKSQRVARKEVASEPVARPALSHFTVTVEAVRPTAALPAHAP